MHSHLPECWESQKLLDIAEYSDHCDPILSIQQATPTPRKLHVDFPVQ